MAGAESEDMERPSASALLLDFDGTMADTVTPLADIYAAFTQRIGAEGAPSFAEANGADLGELIQGLARRFAPQLDPRALWEDYWSRVADAVIAARPCDGLLPLLDWARDRAWKIGIASSSRTALIERWLRRQKLDRYVDDIVGADRAARSKPHPDIYLALLQRLGIAAENCIAIEDSASGVAAARAAQIAVVRIGGIEASAGAPTFIAADLVAAADYVRRRQAGLVDR
jgi:beta-phosphoglucomutase-like phosphatase (HAD superfamily)